MLNLKHVSVSVIGLITAASGAASMAHASDQADKPIFTPYSEIAVTTSDFDYYDGVKTIKDVPYTGVVLDLYPDGAKKSRYSLQDGKAQGIWLDWHPDGSLSYYGEWLDGKGNGPFIYFHPNGEVRERTVAREDVWTGTSEGWNADGSKSFESVFGDGKKISAKTYPVE